MLSWWLLVSLGNLWIPLGGLSAFYPSGLLLRKEGNFAFKLIRFFVCSFLRFIGLRELQRERKKCSHLLAHSPQGCNNQVLASSEEFPSGLLHGCRGSNTRAIWIRSGAAGTGTGTHMGCQHHGVQLNPPLCNAGPSS